LPKRSKNWRGVPLRSDGGAKCRVPANMATRKRPRIRSDWY